MNATIAQLVALACHGNAFLRSPGERPRFFPGNSTCRFCDRITFVELRKRFFAKARENPVAGTPDEWFEHLAQSKALGLRLFYQPQNLSSIFSDRMTAGLVGGGGTWTLGVRYSASTGYWMSDWEVWNRDAPEQRIWRVKYRLLASRRGPTPADRSAVEAKGGFESALFQIHAFAQAHDCAPFIESFRRALDSLADPQTRRGCHKDLYDEGQLSPMSRAMLDAAQSASVFGGMGSWNDLGFDGDAARKYDEVSSRLYAALNDAICAAVNESDTLQAH